MALSCIDIVIETVLTMYTCVIKNVVHLSLIILSIYEFKQNLLY